jgi:hypothetical protein
MPLLRKGKGGFMFDKPSPFDTIQAPKFSHLLAILFFTCLELSMWLMFFAVYSQSIGLMDETYLSDLPLIGEVFYQLDPDANASHIVAILLATFSVSTPLFIWAEIFNQNIFGNLREWISHPQNQIIATIAALVLLLVISLEIVNLYTLIAKEALPIGTFVEKQDSDLMGFLAENKGMAIATSIVIAVINIILALFTTRAFKFLKSSEGDMK